LKSRFLIIPKIVLEILNMGFIDPIIWNGCGVRENILSLGSATRENELAMMQSSKIFELSSGNLSFFNTVRMGKKINA
jgi:hypothetical protein